MALYWAGGNTRYVEPFAGSGYFFFELEPKLALLGDINSELIETYKAVCAQPREVHLSLSGWANSESEYYRVRGLDLGSLGRVERAARFIYLNRFCFNGLYRTNRKGQFNVPYGGNKSGAIPSLNKLIEAATMLRRTELISGDFTETLELVKAGDFVYLDPPFSVTNRRVFSEYDASSFGKKDIIRLRRSLEDLHERGSRFLLSYADCNEGRMLADGFHLSRVVAKRYIAGFTTSRRETIELLISNSRT